MYIHTYIYIYTYVYIYINLHYPLYGICHNSLSLGCLR